MTSSLDKLAEKFNIDENRGKAVIAKVRMSVMLQHHDLVRNGRRLIYELDEWLSLTCITLLGLSS